ncbi:MAG TPA: hypothetical protein VK731_00145, partial [Candidatus Cybelea sp.]|nr:hypothetical protein [Candidatus Cybelea sp.]
MAATEGNYNGSMKPESGLSPARRPTAPIIRLRIACAGTNLWVMRLNFAFVCAPLLVTRVSAHALDATLPLSAGTSHTLTATTYYDPQVKYAEVATS